MQLRVRTNPKTPDGWPRRIAVAFLAGSAAFALTLPFAFFLFLNHFQTAFPKDTENLLSALTASVVTSLFFAALTAAATLGALLFLRFVRSSARSAS